MKYLNRLFLSLLRGKQRETLFHLRNMSEQQLLDCGISPDLVSKGLKGWPWRIENTESELSNQQIFNVGKRKFIESPQSYSDSNKTLPSLSHTMTTDSVQEGHSHTKHKDTTKAA